MNRILLLCCLLAGCSSADEVCPWINSATVGGVLGGPVTVSVTRGGKNKTDASCTFTRQGVSAAYKLQVDVVTVVDYHSEYGHFVAECGSDLKPVRGIGNEAVACTMRGKDDVVSQVVVSRVRDRAFTVRVSDSDQALPASTLRSQALNIAEQVAGNLF